MNHGLVVTLIVSGVVYGTPLLYAALGELFAERSGVLNLGIEGMMLVGAVCAFWVSQLVSPNALGLVLGVAAAAVVGGLMALIHAFVTVSLRANQIVSGLAISILGGAAGLSTYVGQVAHLSGKNGAHRFGSIDVLGLKDLPLVGPVLFHQTVLVYASWVLVAVAIWYLYRTRFGLNLRAVGEDPAAADAMGVDAVRYRYFHTVLGGVLAGVAGACFTLSINPSWTNGVTAGAGFIALALVIPASWRPGRVLLFAYMFGIVTSLGFTLQARGVNVPTELLSALPYLLTIVALVLVSGGVWARRFGAPAALGVPYGREGQ